MIEARSRLPQLSGRLMATDSGMETTLVFKEGYDLPNFEAFILLKSQAGRERLRTYYTQHARTALEAGLGFILETPTWRTNQDWGKRIGIGTIELAGLNRDAIELMHEVRSRFETHDNPIVISGCIGPRGDGYDPGNIMSTHEARDYHAVQISTFAQTRADMVCAMTMTNTPEATGIAQAAKDAAIPSAISFTVETDGRLPTGDTLGDAITAVDAATDAAPAYYMINCAHPDHFMPVLAKGGAWLSRLKGLRANASRCSHAQLDNSTTLDEGDPEELGTLFGQIRRQHPHITVVGGCCGTDHRHIEQICQATA